MAELPHPWAAYERLQQRSSSKTYIDDEYWGLDAALGALLDDAQGVVAQDDVERVFSNAARKERYHDQLRFRYLMPDEEPHDEHADYRAMEARDSMNVMRAGMAEADWTLLESVAAGESYQDLAAKCGLMPGALRTRVSRLRDGLSGA